MFNLDKYPVVYAGSVKNLRRVKEPSGSKPGLYIFEYTDDYSIFDYGKMPDSIAGKGATMAVMSAYIFEQLESPASWKALAASDVWEKIVHADFRKALISSKTMKELMRKGMSTHYKGLRDKSGALVRTDELSEPSNLMEVVAVPIVRPECATVSGTTAWNYNEFHTGLESFLIPLECVFRFGVPKGSSLLDRLALDPGYHRSLGLRRQPKEGTWLGRPILEFFSKLESGDRHLTLEMALNFSGLKTEAFMKLMEWTYLCGIFLLDFFSKAGLRLWDGKFEFTHSEGSPMLADAITPDELRLTRRKIQISKEPIRQYYRRHERKFYRAIKRAKILAHQTQREIREVMDEDLGYRPGPMEAEFLEAMEAMYTGLTREITGLEFFEPRCSLTQAVQTIRNYV